jgi:flavin-dependent dehydrogenase
MGGGLAGMAASLLLRRRGWHVTCIGPTPEPDYSLGESLDFAAPALFTELGFDCDTMVRDNSATYKRLIKVVTETGEAFILHPGNFLESRLGLSTTTIHVDRSIFDASLRQAAQESGVELIDTKVARLTSSGDAITSCVTKEGEYSARWYVDASSRARLATRHFNIPCTRYGEPKVAIWSHIESVSDLGGTTIHVANRAPYLDWIWEIPVTRNRLSIGLVLSNERLKACRRPGEAMTSLLVRKMNALERFRNIRASTFKTPVRTCAFSNSVVERSFGANWLAIGEAAAMVDPLTSSGASAAIRHARMAATILDDALSNVRPDQHLLENYGRCVQLLGSSFNRNIEKTIYDPTLRKNMSMFWAAFSYTAFGYFFNALYERFDFRSDRDMRRMRMAERSFAAWLSAWRFAGRCLQTVRRPAEHANS